MTLRKIGVILANCLTMVCIVASPTHAANNGTPFQSFATKLLSGIDHSARVAIQPFDENETALRPDAAASLNGRLLRALKSQAGAKMTFIDRADLLKAWSEAEEFRDARIRELMRSARVDVLIVGRATLGGAGVTLSYKELLFAKKTTR